MPILPSQALTDFLLQAMSYLPTNWIAPIELQPGRLSYAVMKAHANGDYNQYVNLDTVANGLSLVTATGAQIDDIAASYFKVGIFPRLSGESDASYKGRIITTLVTPTVTPTGMIAVIETWLGTTANVFEKMDQCTYQGGYIGGSNIGTGSGPSAYNTVGMYEFSLPAYEGALIVWQPNPSDPHYETATRIRQYVTQISPIGIIVNAWVVGPASNGYVAIG